MCSILIVEDEYASRLGLQAIIKSSGLQCKDVYTANNGEAAMKIIQCHPIDVVITDICMPIMDGLQLCAEIRQNWPDILIFIISGHDDFKYAQQAIKIQCKRILFLSL